jgi:phospholipid/cholesterol/gamma-HCH transport system substrate-binding protein
METFSKQDPRFVELGRKTVIFLILAGALAVGTVLAVLINQDFFTKTTRLYFFADSAQGIAKGMSVQLSGFKIGTVDEIALEPNATVKVRLVINSQYTHFIRVDSRAQLAKEGLIGASNIEITPGSPQMREVLNDGVLKFNRARDISDIAPDLAARIGPILTDIKSITESINDPNGDIRQTLKSVRQASAQLAEAAAGVNKIASTGDARLADIQGRINIVLDRAGASVNKASTVIDNLGGTLAIVDKALPDILLKLNSTLQNADAASVEVRRLTSLLSADLPPAVVEGRALMQDTREVVQGAKKTWPLRNFVPRAEEQALPLDSHDDARNKH